MIRKAFTCQSAEQLLISADYSQIELRLLAHLAKADSLINTFNSGLDIHWLTAAKVFDLDLAAVTGEQRSIAKAVNFGIIYGMGARKLAKTVNTTVGEAQDFIDLYFSAYPEVKNFTEHLIQRTSDYGYSETPCGRRRTIEGLNSTDGRIYAHARNTAVNSCTQGYAADLIKLAMLKVDAALTAAGLQTKMLLQIHDELLFECPRHELAAATEIIKTGMETAQQGAVRFHVNIKHGDNWLDAK